MNSQFGVRVQYSNILSDLDRMPIDSLTQDRKRLYVPRSLQHVGSGREPFISPEQNVVALDHTIFDSAARSQISIESCSDHMPRVGDGSGRQVLVQVGGKSQCIPPSHGA
ncbi:hypothetical protein GPX89_29725 [Nocardia sp. ET3-3]|uniref:Uncharacterized protein n=1 Tax=Nocardia terrae TaxID=2675851 RepID=A0A7K1V4P9_9NOCA|nr:hypothetical protein [Nocardia terrae]MVU81409.1 hypothetical protein [Nocardia terrae]